MFAMDRDVKKKKKAGEVNDCRQIRISECENVFVLAGQAGAEFETSRRKESTVTLGTCFLLQYANEQGRK